MFGKGVAGHPQRVPRGSARAEASLSASVTGRSDARPSRALTAATTASLTGTAPQGSGTNHKGPVESVDFRLPSTLNMLKHGGTIVALPAMVTDIAARVILSETNTRGS